MIYRVGYAVTIDTRHTRITTSGWRWAKSLRLQRNKSLLVCVVTLRCVVRVCTHSNIRKRFSYIVIVHELLLLTVPLHAGESSFPKSFFTNVNLQFESITIG